MKKLLIAFAYMITFFTYACSTGQAQSNGSLLVPKDYQQKIEVLTKEVILDVRTPEEYRDGHLVNAVNMDWENDAFNTQIKSLDKNAPVFVYCYGGGRSSDAAKELRKQGFSQVYDLKGGFEAWQKAGLPEEK